jgi:hypothetical protein
MNHRQIKLPAIGLAFALLGCGEDVVSLTPGASVVVKGDGSCRSLPFPRTCFRYDDQRAACVVRPDGTVDRLGQDPLPILDEGCVGAVLTFPEGQQPDVTVRSGVATYSAPAVVEAERRSGTRPSTPCCAENVPGSALPHIVSFDATARALFIRTAEPVRGPTQLAIAANLTRLLGLPTRLPTGGRVEEGFWWRVYVGGVPGSRP